MRKIKLFFLTGLSFCMAPGYALNDWERIRAPLPSKQPETIGGYTNGCVLASTALPLKGTGFQVIRKQRLRYYGHPDLIGYLKNLGNKVAKNKLPTLLIGDMAMPAGGPFTKGHRSHQTGLDVDIWLRPGPTKLDRPRPLNVVNKKTFYTNGSWTKAHERIIKLAAEDPKVQRIFVNAAIKRKLCASPGNKSWLRKVRPWGGHNYHFHVRLKCPKGSLRCKGQKDVSWGSGCGAEVAKWDWRKWKKPSKKIKKKKTKRKARPKLPMACMAAAL